MNQEECIREDLEKIYADVSEWGKFAETKHAGGIVLWTALIVATFTADKFYGLCDTLQICIFSALFVGMIINVLAMMPFTNHIPWLRALCFNVYKNRTNQNLLFYRSIFILVGQPKLKIDIKVQKYKEVLKEEYGCIPQGKLIRDYIEQIIEVATVASIKIFLFSVSTWYLLLFVIATFLYIVIF